jgi:hypothetical protein
MCSTAWKLSCGVKLGAIIETLNPTEKALGSHCCAGPIVVTHCCETMRSDNISARMTQGATIGTQQCISHLRRSSDLESQCNRDLRDVA